MKSVLIAGAGPSGLMAAHAALSAGYGDIMIYDARPAKPDGKTAGVFYLHDHCDIPNIPCTTLHTYGEGTAEEYARKLYGKSIKTSFPEQSRFDVVYDGMYALGWLWDQFEPLIWERKLTQDDIFNALQTYDRVVSTVPLDVLYGTAMFPSVSSYIATAPADPTLAYVEYHGNPNNPLYRASAVFGREALEFVPGASPLALLTNNYRIHTVKKVLPAKRIDLWMGHDRLLFAGRYGAWDKRCLTHDVYTRVKEWLTNERPSERSLGGAVAPTVGTDRLRDRSG